MRNFCAESMSVATDDARSPQPTTMNTADTYTCPHGCISLVRSSGRTHDSPRYGLRFNGKLLGFLTHAHQGFITALSDTQQRGVGRLSDFSNRCRVRPGHHGDNNESSTMEVCDGWRRAH